MAAVYIHPDPDSLALAAARLIAQEACRAVEERGCFVIALAGGTTPRRAYERLAEPPFLELVPWQDTHAFWTDERCVDSADPRSNERMARESLLDRVPIPQGQIHPMRCGSSGAAARYESLLRTYPRLDLVLLGLGADGHAASLFPHSPVLSEKERWVAPAPAEAVGTDGGTLPRMTLTAACINAARHVVFLVSGAAKAQAVKAALEGRPGLVDLPTLLIHPVSGALSWLLDREAAALLSGTTSDGAG